MRKRGTELATSVGTLLIAGALVGGGTPNQGAQTNAASNEQRICLVPGPSASKERVEALKDHLASNLAIAVHTEDRAPSKKADTASNFLSHLAKPAGDHASKAKPTECGMRIGIYEQKTPMDTHALYRYDPPRSVVLLDRFRAEGTNTLKHTKYRLEKVTIRSVGVLFELNPTPIPRSPLFPYQNLEQLDRMSRNMDPPTLRKVQKAAQKAGYRLIPDNPYFLLSNDPSKGAVSPP